MQQCNPVRSLDIQSAPFKSLVLLSILTFKLTRLTWLTGIPQAGKIQLLSNNIRQVTLSETFIYIVLGTKTGSASFIYMDLRGKDGSAPQ